MPTIRRPGPPSPDPNAPAPPGERTATSEHSLSGLHVPEETTPTWELEMLVSGAVLFGLLQVPPVVSSAFASLVPRLSERAYLVVFEGTMFLKIILFALIGGFVVHLASRAYWVALVGLDSVFPGGIRWDQGTFGPITRDVFRTRFVSLPARIERIDNFASVLFAAAFGIVFLLLTGIVLLGSFAGIAFLATRWVFDGRLFRPLFYILMAIGIGVPLVAYTVDRRLGRKLARDGVVAKAISRVVRVAYRLQGVAIHGPITQTLLSNVRKRIMWPAMMLTMFAAVTAGVLDMAVARNVISVDSYGLLPASGPGVTDYRHYADQRLGDDVYATGPFIQSEVVRDPYVRLFVPYRPRRDDEALAQACPSVAPQLRRAGGDALTRADAALLACMSSVRAVSLDGRSVDPGFRFYTEPQSRLKGLLGYISTDGLAKGRHMLVVRAGPADSSARAGAAPPADSIPFLF